MKILFTFDGHETEIVGMYWEVGQHVEGEIFHKKGNFKKEFKHMGLKKVANLVISSHTDGKLVEMDNLNMARNYLGKNPKLILSMPHQSF